LEKVRFLTENNASMATQKEGYTALHSAVSGTWYDMELVRYLVEKSSDVATKDKNGDTPLDLAARNGHGEVVALLSSSMSKAESSDGIIGVR
jgi:ankyrin repeat protein